MSELASNVTRKGQVTVPIEIRRALGVTEGDHVTLVLEDGVSHGDQGAPLLLEGLDLH